MKRHWTSTLKVFFDRLYPSRRREETELDEELRFHLEMETRRNVERGMTPAAAARAARLDFGGVEAVKDACRDVRPWHLVDDLARDVRESLRALRRAPVFAAAAIASLAIGIGATTVIYSMVDAVLLRPLPFHEPERLLRFWETTPEGVRFSSSDLNLLDFQELNQTFDGIAALAFPPPQLSLQTAAGPRLLSGLSVTAPFFDVLGIEPVLGRAFGPEEEVPGSTPRVLVLSHSTWKTRFGGDPEIVGQDLELDGERWTVIGVLPDAARAISPATEAWVPYVIDPTRERGDHRLDAFARLRPGASLDQARADLAALAARLGEEYPESNAGWGVALVPVSEWIIGPDVTLANFVLLGAVALLLLLACANVSNLLLARASHRGDELGLRVALGASRGRVLRQLLAESLVLGLAGAGAGMVIAFLAIPALSRLDELPFPRMDEMALDGRALLVALAAGLATSLIFGLAPALQSTGAAVARAARGGRQGSEGRRGSRLRTGLVVAELALAMVLAIGAGLLARSFHTLGSVDQGFDHRGVVAADIALPAERYGEGSDAVTDFYRRLEERIAAIPGVSSVGSNVVSPFRGPRPSNSVAREDEVDRDNFVFVQWRAVTPGFFRTARVPFLRGQTLDDDPESPLRAVVSAQLAERLWPGEDPIGKSVRWNRPDGSLFEVAGVVGEVRDLALEMDPPPMIYLPQARLGWPSMTVMVRTDLPPEGLVSDVRRAIQEIDPLLAPRQIATLESNRSTSLAGSRLELSALAVFSAVALTLAAIGVFGLVAYAVARRRREIGVRVALGARPVDVTRLVVGRGLVLVGGGVVLGLLGVLATSGVLGKLLYQTSPFDPWVLAGVAGLLSAVGLVACWAPARRAAGGDPVRALREE